MLRSEIQLSARSTIFSVGTIRISAGNWPRKPATVKGIDGDVYIQTKLLSILYARRRQNIREPGVGNQELELLLGCPPEHLEFHIWYLKEKAWIGKTESGTLAITVEGVDHVSSEHHRKTSNKLLTDQSDKA